MGNIHEMTHSEKDLLTVIGKVPHGSLRELLNYTEYKRTSTIVRKLEEFKKQKILRGPIYDIDYGKLCRNALHRFFCIIETNQSTEAVVSYFQIIEPFAWMFPVLPPYKNLLNMGFFSSDDTETKALLQLLKEGGIITDYVVRVSCHERVIENPNFFGDVNPPAGTLFDFCDNSTPNMSPGHHDTNWSECDIAILPYLRTGYKGAKLVEILKAEKKLQKTWTYSQIKYSREKMVKNGLIRKKYVIYPFPYNQCAHFVLFLKLQDTRLTQKMVCSFAKGARMYKELILCENWGLIECVSHPLFLTDLVNKLDSIVEIEEKEVYQLRSISEKYSFTSPPLLTYFDFETQTLEYPYHVYREKIKEKLERENF